MLVGLEGFEPPLRVSLEEIIEKSGNLLLGKVLSYLGKPQSGCTLRPKPSKYNS